MTHNNFKHREVEAGYKTPCHEPLARHGGPRARNEEGYVFFPRTVEKGNRRRVWRFAHTARYEGVNGPVKDQLDHLCRNRWCCNPSHLEDVTTAVNVRRGDCTKLEEIEVLMMRALRAEGAMSIKDIGAEFGISASHASRVTRGLYWSSGPCAHWEQRKRGTQNL